MINIILCGGSGVRLWPLSRDGFPKQFYPFFEEESLFQKTVKRNQIFSETIVVLNKKHLSIAQKQIESINSKISTYFVEPFAKNTAPAVAIPLFSLSEEEIILVTPSDHLILDETNYQESIFKAEKLAKEGFLVTFGVNPTKAEIGFGYIKAEGDDVISFHEKPTYKKAEEYFKSGEYFWNSGIFCFKVKTFLDELKKYEPEIYEQSKISSQNIFLNENEEQIIHLDPSKIDKIPSKSIDYSVMERSKIVKVVQATFDWSDLGTFESLSDVFKKDNYGNITKKNFIYSESNSNSVFSENRTITLIDVDELIVVDTIDTLLITKKGSSHKIKNLIEMLKDEDCIFY